MTVEDIVTEVRDTPFMIDSLGGVRYSKADGFNGNLEVDLVVPPVEERSDYFVELIHILRDGIKPKLKRKGMDVSFFTPFHSLYEVPVEELPDEELRELVINSFRLAMHVKGDLGYFDIAFRGSRYTVEISDQSLTREGVSPVASSNLMKRLTEVVPQKSFSGFSNANEVKLKNDTAKLVNTILHHPRFSETVFYTPKMVAFPDKPSVLQYLRSKSFTDEVLARVEFKKNAADALSDNVANVFYYVESTDILYDACLTFLRNLDQQTQRRPIYYDHIVTNPEVVEASFLALREKHPDLNIFEKFDLDKYKQDIYEALHEEFTTIFKRSNPKLR